jgi:hypothetical protein
MASGSWRCRRARAMAESGFQNSVRGRRYRRLLNAFRRIKFFHDNITYPPALRDQDAKRVLVPVSHRRIFI